MTAPVRTIAAKFTAQGSEVVQAALAKVTAAAQSATQKIAQASQVQAQGWQRGVQAAERAAHAEQGLRERNTQQAIQAAARVSQATVASATATSKAVSDRYGIVALSVASSFNQMAFAGKITGAGIRNVMVQTATVAASVFGVGGPVVAAIAVTALTVTNLFRGARAESAALVADWEKQQRILAARGDYAGAGGAIRDLLAGDPSSDDAFAQQGLLKLRDAVRNARAGQTRRALPGGGFEIIASRAETLRIQEMEAALAKLEARYRSMQTTFDTLAGRETSRLSTIADLEAEAKRRPRLPDSMLLQGTPLPARGRYTSAALDARVDESLGLVGGRPVIQPLGDPKKFAAQLTADVAESFKHFKLPPMPEQVEWQQAFATTISMTLIDGFGAGIERAFASGSIGEGFAVLSGALLSGLGTAMMDFGTAALVASTLMAKIRASLATLNPVAGAAAAAALIAAGAALRGVASRAFGGNGRSGGGGSGGGSYAGAAAAASNESVTRLVFGQNSIGTAAGMTPRVAKQFVVIGPDDPRAQRALMDLIRKAEGRGMGGG